MRCSVYFQLPGEARELDEEYRSFKEKNETVRGLGYAKVSFLLKFNDQI